MPDTYKEIDPFTNIPYAALPVSEVSDTFLPDVRSLQIGQGGNNIFRADKQGIWLGAKEFADAPFSVDMAGNIIATSLDLSNYLQVGDALPDVQVDITGLSDITADLGTITAGAINGIVITGGTVRTANSTTRVEMNGTNNDLEVYVSGVLRTRMAASGLEFFEENEFSAGILIGSQIDTLGVVIDDLLRFNFTDTGFLPASSSSYDLGDNLAVWNNLYVGVINGNGGLSIAGAGGAVTFIANTGGGSLTEFFFNANSATDAVAQAFSVFNDGAGGSYAMSFSGDEVVSAAVGGSQNKKIAIKINGTDYFIPAYTA